MGIPTYIYIELPPPETVGIGESFRVEGWLADVDGNRVPFMPINLYADGVKVDEDETVGGGYWSTSATLHTRGAHTVHVEFPGDATYDPSSSDVYTITAVGVETRITEVDAPPSDVGVGEPFYIYGILEEYIEPVWKGLINKTVELWADGTMVRAERTGFTFSDYDPGLWRFVVPAPQTLGVHTVEVRFPSDETREPCSSGVLEFNAIESGVVATIENLARIPTKVEPGERWGAYFHLCNRGTGAGNVRAVISGDIEGETPIITMSPGDCQTIAIGAGGPAIFTIRTGV